MIETVTEESLNQAERLISYSDKEILALSLTKNINWGENYTMTMNVKLKRALNSLNSNMKSLRKSLNISSWVMGIMTFFILILTGVIVWKGF